MRTRDKIILVILLAVLSSWLFGCNREHSVPAPALVPKFGRVDTAYMRVLYTTYNDAYFQNRLPKNTVVDMLEPNPDYMASTTCDNDACEIHFNQDYVVAARTAKLTMLHEMCHVKTWGKDETTFGEVTEQIQHGRRWRSCMLELDAEGANREILIDNYHEDIQ